jgi:Flp pilus assembly protein TadG
MNKKLRNQKGSASMEFALGAALVLTPLLLGMTDFSRYLNVDHVISRAAHEGAFTASRGTDPSSVVKTYVTQAGLDAAKVTVVLSPVLSTASRGDAMKVTVSYNLTDYALASWGSLFPQSVSTAATARHE